MTDTETVATRLPAERAAVWEDFIDIFYAPSLVFARRARGSFWIPFFVVTFAIGALFYLNSGVLQPVMDGEFNRAMAAAMRTNPRLTPEMADRFRQTGVRLAQVAGFLIVPVAIFFTGSAVWVIGKLFEAKQTYQAALVVAAYAWVPRIVEAVLNGLQGLFLDPSQLNGRFRLTLGVGRFFDPDATSPIFLAFIGRIDVFTIWVTVLLAIGLSVTGGISRSRAALAAPLIWAAGALPILLQAFRAG
jgi:Yip1 domain